MLRSKETSKQIIHNIETTKNKTVSDIPINDLNTNYNIKWIVDQILDYSANDSMVVCSNLRRTISTAIIALWKRFSNNNESIHILPSLQELGIHLNAQTPSKQIPKISEFEINSFNLNINQNQLINFYKNRLKIEDNVSNFGFKTLADHKNKEFIHL